MCWKLSSLKGKEWTDDFNQRSKEWQDIPSVRSSCAGPGTKIQVNTKLVPAEVHFHHHHANNISINNNNIKNILEYELLNIFIIDLISEISDNESQISHHFNFLSSIY